MVSPRAIRSMIFASISGVRLDRGLRAGGVFIAGHSFRCHARQNTQQFTRRQAPLIVRLGQAICFALFCNYPNFCNVCTFLQTLQLLQRLQRLQRLLQKLRVAMQRLQRLRPIPL